VEALVARMPPRTTASRAIVDGINQVAARSGEKLRFVLLVGDAPAPGEHASGYVPLPALYLPKVGYENHRPDEHGHGHAFPSDEHDHAARHEGEVYPTDLPYAYANRNALGRPELAAAKSPAPLAVGRVPARTPEEAANFARKAIRYDEARAEGPWRRRIMVVGGPANFGRMVDSFIEATATVALDTAVPYDYDVRVIFPKIESPYAYPFASLRQRVASDLNDGALIAAYVGHGAPTSFDDVHFKRRHYYIATADDLERLQIADGKPFFVSITCNNGFFDLPYGRRSIAEVMVLNPDGPIAAFASSRESHPYSNALYGQALVEVFMQGRPPTIGEGVLDVKQRMLVGNIPLAPTLFDSDPEALNEEHEGLYNLFGDPATALRYPAAATLSIDGAPSSVAPGAALTLAVEAPAVPSGKAALTIETRRSVIRGKLVPPDELTEMTPDEAFAAMAKNYATASDKVVARAEQPIAGGRAALRVKAPSEPGEYVIKVFAAGGGEAASGHARIHVGKASSSPPGGPGGKRAATTR
jgi:hypothetical protein